MKYLYIQLYSAAPFIGLIALYSMLIPAGVCGQKYYSHIISRGDTSNAGLQFLQKNGKYYINEYYACNTHIYGCHRIIEIDPNGEILHISDEFQIASRKPMIAVDERRNRFLVLGNTKNGTAADSTVTIKIINGENLKEENSIIFPKIDSLTFLTPDFIIPFQNFWFVGINGYNPNSKKKELCLLKLDSLINIVTIKIIDLPEGIQSIENAFFDSKMSLNVLCYNYIQYPGSRIYIKNYDFNLNENMTYVSEYADIRQLPIGMEIPDNKTLFATITDLSTLSAELHVLDKQNNVKKLTPWNAQPGQLREIEKLIYSKDGQYIGGGKHADATTGPLGKQLLFFKINTSGTLVFERYFVMDNIYRYGGYTDINDIIELEDGSFLVVGLLQTYRQQEDNSLKESSDLIWMRLSPLGCFSDESCLIEVKIENTIVGTSNENKPSIDFSQLYPNPAFDQISFSGNFHPNEIRFSDILGKSCTVTSSHNGTFDTSSLPPGLYVASWTEQNLPRSQKILVLK